MPPDWLAQERQAVHAQHENGFGHEKARREWNGWDERLAQAPPRPHSQHGALANPGGRADRVNARAEDPDAVDLSLRNHHPLF